MYGLWVSSQIDILSMCKTGIVIDEKNAVMETTLGIFLARNVCRTAHIIRTHTHTHKNAHTLTCTHTHTHTCIQTHVHVYMHTNSYADKSRVTLDFYRHAFSKAKHTLRFEFSLSSNQKYKQEMFHLRRYITKYANRLFYCMFHCFISI